MASYVFDINQPFTVLNKSDHDLKFDKLSNKQKKVKDKARQNWHKSTNYAISLFTSAFFVFSIISAADNVIVAVAGLSFLVYLFLQAIKYENIAIKKDKEVRSINDQIEALELEQVSDQLASNQDQAQLYLYAKECPLVKQYLKQVAVMNRPLYEFEHQGLLEVFNEFNKEALQSK